MGTFYVTEEFGNITHNLDTLCGKSRYNDHSDLYIKRFQLKFLYGCATMIAVVVEYILLNVGRMA